MLNEAPKSAFKVLVTFESREDGGLRAYCEDVPGFVLSNPSCDVVLTGVEPTLETILSAMWGSPVRVSSLLELHEIRNGLQESGIIPSGIVYLTKQPENEHDSADRPAISPAMIEAGVSALYRAMGYQLEGPVQDGVRAVLESAFLALDKVHTDEDAG